MEAYMKQLAGLGAAIAFSALLATSSVAFASNPSEILTKATVTAEHMKSDPAFGAARSMVDRARGMLIVPNLTKGGFIFGAEGGDGVLVAKTATGWSEPAFYGMGSASFGLQAGLEKAEIVMLIMSDKAMSALQTGSFKVGAGAGLTVATLSGGAEAATGDIVVWTSATGAYGGLTLNGSSIKPHDDWNKSFYGRPVTVQEILAGKVQNPSTLALRTELSKFKSG
jgi:lipid-binding SYLF domain-containing protein